MDQASQDAANERRRRFVEVSSTDRTPAGIEPGPRPAGPEETIQEDPTGRAGRSEKAAWTVTLFRSPAHFEKRTANS
jgi:hypothetical protein